jgi:hypothetical protein
MVGPHRLQETPIVPHVANSPSDLLDALSAAVHLDGERLVIDD